MALTQGSYVRTQVQGFASSDCAGRWDDEGAQNSLCFCQESAISYRSWRAKTFEEVVVRPARALRLVRDMLEGNRATAKSRSSSSGSSNIASRSSRSRRISTRRRRRRRRRRRKEEAQEDQSRHHQHEISIGRDGSSAVVWVVMVVLLSMTGQY